MAFSTKPAINTLECDYCKISVEHEYNSRSMPLPKGWTSFVLDHSAHYGNDEGDGSFTTRLILKEACPDCTPRVEKAIINFDKGLIFWVGERK